MIVQITRYELELIEREYENSIKSSLSDDDDLFIPINDVGMCKIKKGMCRQVIDYGNLQLSRGKQIIDIKIDRYE